MLKSNLFFILISSVFFFSACSGSNQVKENPNGVKPGVFQAGKSVTFVFKSVETNTKSVAITGDFNNWNENGIALHFVNEVWTVSLTLEYGVYQYKYIINGKDFITDPYAEAFAPDGKGGKNAILEVKKE